MSLYIAITGVFYLFLRAKKKVFQTSGTSNDQDGPAQHDPGLYRGQKGLSGAIAIKTYAVLGSMVGAALLAIFVIFIVSRFDLLYSIVHNVIGFGIILLACTAVYLFIKPFIENQNGVFRIALDFIMFLPCLITASIKWMIKEKNDTKPIVLYVIAIEAVLILLYYLLPYVFGQIVKRTHGELTYIN